MRLVGRDSVTRVHWAQQRANVFEYIEMFNNPKCKHTNNGMLSPVDFEMGRQNLNEEGV